MFHFLKIFLKIYQIPVNSIKMYGPNGMMPTTFSQVSDSFLIQSLITIVYCIARSAVKHTPSKIKTIIDTILIFSVYVFVKFFVIHCFVT